VTVTFIGYRTLSDQPQEMENNMNRLKRRSLALTLSVIGLVATVPLVRAQDADAGKTVFNKCQPCHSIGEGAVIKVGPPLNGIDGRKAGTYPSYPYSDANKNSGITWNEAEFKDYIRSPRAKIPNTKMAFIGLTNDKDIADIWAYISQFKADGTKK
jgi:cytochrome c